MSNKTKPFKIFISHSSQDLPYIQPLVELLECIGLNPETIFCSSVAGFNIPLDSNIYEYLKNQFQNYDLRVIFVLSENYYKSPACLNEMGAAWILQNKYTSVLLPGFDFKSIKGVIDQMRISIKLDSDESELKARLNELRDTLIHEIGLEAPCSFRQQNRWEEHRNRFVEQIGSAAQLWKQIRKLRETNRPLEEWINPLLKIIDMNPASYDAMYMLGTIYSELNNTEKAIKYLKTVENKSLDTNLREESRHVLNRIGYIV